MNYTFIITFAIIKDVPDCLSDLKVVDELGFVSNTKRYSIFFHHSIHHSIVHNTNRLILYEVYKGIAFLCLFIPW